MNHIIWFMNFSSSIDGVFIICTVFYKAINIMLAVMFDIDDKNLSFFYDFAKEILKSKIRYKSNYKKAFLHVEDLKII